MFGSALLDGRMDGGNKEKWGRVKGLLFMRKTYFICIKLYIYRNTGILKTWFMFATMVITIKPTLFVHTDEVTTTIQMINCYYPHST